MPPKLTTHVLDTFSGRAAAGVQVVLRRDGVQLFAGRTNADGRTDAPLLEGDAFGAGTYELDLDVGGYFAGVPGTPEAPFLTVVTLRFSVSEPNGYHVPLLVSPWAYTTYRGT